MLEVDQLVKSFQDVRAVEGLTFHVGAGEIVGLVGPNGSGKTTTIRCLCGILKPDCGQIVVNGFDLLKNEIEAKRAIAYIPEVPNPYDLLTVREHIQFVAMAFDTMDSFNAQINGLLERFDLKEKEHSLVAGLSKGMKQKLAVACAFVHNAKVFLCDEPFIGVDPKGQHALKLDLKRLRSEGCAVLISTHQLDTAERLCDRIIILKKGKKLVEGTVSELQEQARMDGKALEDIFIRLTDTSDESAALPR